MDTKGIKFCSMGKNKKNSLRTFFAQSAKSFSTVLINFKDRKSCASKNHVAECNCNEGGNTHLFRNVKVSQSFIDIMVPMNNNKFVKEITETFLDVLTRPPLV